MFFVGFYFPRLLSFAHAEGKTHRPPTPLRPIAPSGICTIPFNAVYLQCQYKLLSAIPAGSVLFPGLIASPTPPKEGLYHSLKDHNPFA